MSQPGQPMPSAQAGQFSSVVIQQPEVGGQAVIGLDRSKNYNCALVAAIISCFLCCWCTGGAAIAKALNARSNAKQGLAGKAQKSANHSRILIVVTIFLGIGISVGLYFYNKSQ